MLIIWNDIYAAFREISLQDLCTWACVGLWFILLLLPLKQIYREDFITALTFMVVMTALAAFFWFRLPEAKKDNDHFFKEAGSLGLASVIALGRWYGLKEKNKKIDKKLEVQASGKK